MTTNLQKTRVDLAGLMRVLGEALYSTPHVAIRELVQNGHDSCARRAIESEDAFRPAIAVTSTPGTLTITDNGAGLTLAEIHSYLATVGAGYTRTLRDAGQGEGLIGYFGLGFLSAFAVGEKVEVWTCSFREPNLAHRFISRSGETYTVDIAEPRPVGTEVKLTLRSEVPDLGDVAVVRDRLERYCCLLRYPVLMNGGPAVNANPPPWREQGEISPLRLRTLSLEFARRFEKTFDPMATIKISLPEQELAGMLWIQDGGSFATSDNRNVSVFVRGMLISEDEPDLLPRWAGFVGGVLESQRMQPTASRESLREDAVYAQAKQALHKCLVEAMSRMAADDAPTWRRVLARHNEALLGAALVDDELFALVADEVMVPTTEGDLTVPALLQRCAGRVYVSHSDRDGVESILLRALKLPVVLGSRYAAAPFCTRFTRERRGELVVLGTHAGDERVFQNPELDAARIAALQQWFAAPDREVLVRRFDPDFLPFALVVDRDAELKRRMESDEADRRIGHAILGLARNFTRQLAAQQLVRMYVNSANPLVIALFDCPELRRARVLTLLQPLAALMLGTQAGMDIETALRTFTTTLLDEMRQP